MQHKIEIDITTHGYPWQISGKFNDQVLELRETTIIGLVNLEDINRMQLTFTGKNAVHNPDMLCQINGMKFDYIDVSPVLYRGVHHTDHLKYPTISPCLDININGVWILYFNNDFMTGVLKGYLGL